jgi:hypothetical protein
LVGTVALTGGFRLPLVRFGVRRFWLVDCAGVEFVEAEVSGREECARSDSTALIEVSASLGYGNAYCVAVTLCGTRGLLGGVRRKWHLDELTWSLLA